MSRQEIKQRSSKSSILTLLVLSTLLIFFFVLGGFYVVWCKVAELKGLTATRDGYVTGFKKDASSASEHIGPIFSLEPMVLNVGSGTRTRHMRITIQLEANEKETLIELEKIRPKIIDYLIDILPTKNVSDFYDVEAKEATKQDIVGAVNKMLVSGKVLNAYISGFVFQDT